MLLTSENILLDPPRPLSAHSSPSAARRALTGSTRRSAVTLPAFAAHCPATADPAAAGQVLGVPREARQTWRLCAPERVGGGVVRQ